MNLTDGEILYFLDDVNLEIKKSEEPAVIRNDILSQNCSRKSCKLLYILIIPINECLIELISTYSIAFHIYSTA